jgi:hypothetical protein
MRTEAGMRSSALLMAMMYIVPAEAQTPLETTLVVQQGGREIGREEFTLRPGRGRGAQGSTLIAAARYPARNPTTRLAATLERTEEFALAKFQLDVESGGAVTVILAAGSGARLIVRTVAAGSESGRELPGGPDVVLLDDQVYSLFGSLADLATPAGRTLTAIFPRSGKRATLRAKKETGSPGGTVKVALTGDVAGTLLTDAQGRLQRLDLPTQGIVVVRAE